MPKTVYKDLKNDSVNTGNYKSLHLVSASKSILFLLIIQHEWPLYFANVVL